MATTRSRSVAPFAASQSWNSPAEETGTACDTSSGLMAPATVRELPATEGRSRCGGHTGTVHVPAWVARSKEKERGGAPGRYMPAVGRRRRREPASTLAAASPSRVPAARSIGRPGPPVNGRTPPPGEEPPGAVEEAPPTAAVVVVPPLLEVAPLVLGARGRGRAQGAGGGRARGRGGGAQGGGGGGR